MLSALLMFLPCFAALAQNAPQVPLFFARSDYLIESQDIALGDVNGDGIPDIIVLDGLGFVTVGIGTGTGQFAPLPRFNFLGIIGGVRLAVADLNGDGILDIAGSDDNDSNLYYAFGKGDGTFGPAQSLTIAPQYQHAVDIRLIDINGDGKADILTASGNGLSVALNQGGGVFSTVTAYGTGTYVSLAVQDVNHDGKIDVVAASLDGLVTLLGNGTGSFQVSAELPISGGLNVLVAGDVNGDGNVDVVASPANSFANTTYFGNGDGTFRAGPSNIGTNKFGQMALVDLDEDGKLDLVIAGVLLLKGNGDGSFVNPISFPVGEGSFYFAVGHLRNALHWDIVTADGGSETVSLLLQKKGLSYGNGVGYTLKYQPGQIVKADFNGDGFPDIAVASPTFVQVFFGTGKASAPFIGGPKLYYINGSSLLGLATADFDRDGKADLAISTSGPDSLSVYLGKGNGTFHQPFTELLDNSSGAILTGDFNGDGLVDVVMEDGTVYYGKGDGTLGTRVTFAPSPDLGTYHTFAVADFNRDGIDDVVLNPPFAEQNNVSVAFGARGTGLETPAITPVNGVGGTYIYGVGDFNSDGIPDIVAVTGDYDQIFVLLGNGDGTFRVLAPITTPVSILQVTSILIGDYNNDGNPDILLALPGHSCVPVYLGNGDGTFFSGEAYGAGYSPSYMVQGPFEPGISTNTVIVSDASGTLQVLNQRP